MIFIHLGPVERQKSLTCFLPEPTFKTEVTEWETDMEVEVEVVEAIEVGAEEEAIVVEAVEVAEEAQVVEVRACCASTCTESAFDHSVCVLLALALRRRRRRRRGRRFDPTGRCQPAHGNPQRSVHRWQQAGGAGKYAGATQGRTHQEIGRTHVRAGVSDLRGRSYAAAKDPTNI